MISVLLLLLFTCCASLSYLLCFCTAFSRPVSWKEYVRYVAYNVGLLILSNIILPRTFDVLFMFITVTYTAGAAFVIFHQQGFRLLVSGCFLTSVGLLIDLISGLLIGSLLGWPYLEKASLREPIALMFVDLSTLFSGFILSFIIFFIKKAFFFLKRKKTIFLYLRPILLFTLVLFISLNHIERTLSFNGLDFFKAVFYAYLPIILIALVSISYIFQDIRHIRLLQQNQTLQQQIKLNATLSEESRSFRHNISNMLYGFEGSILNGSLHDIQEYYQQISRRCAAENNSNFSSIQQIGCPSIAALILRKIEKAQDTKVSFYLSVSPALRWKHLPYDSICLILGVLLDNAIEAAQLCSSAFVCVSITDFSGHLEILIKNTYDFESETDAFLLEGTGSSKQGHMGMGLASLRNELKQCPNLVFNQFASGRFVTSILTMI